MPRRRLALRRNLAGGEHSGQTTSTVTLPSPLRITKHPFPQLRWPVNSATSSPAATEALASSCTLTVSSSATRRPLAYPRHSRERALGVGRACAALLHAQPCARRLRRCTLVAMPRSVTSCGERQNGWADHDYDIQEKLKRDKKGRGKLWRSLSAVGGDRRPWRTAAMGAVRISDPSGEGWCEWA